MGKIILLSGLAFSVMIGVAVAEPLGRSTASSDQPRTVIVLTGTQMKNVTAGVQPLTNIIAKLIRATTGINIPPGQFKKLLGT
jgi:hypothetical protein